MSVLLFVYGSLMCPQSCFRTLKREINYKPALLKGYERVFNAKALVHSLLLEKNILVNFANLRENKDKVCHGLLFEIEEEEIIKLQEREFFYDFKNVSEQIISEVDIINKKIFTFIADEKKEDHLIHIEKELRESHFILKNYLKIMSEAPTIKNIPEIKNQIIGEINLLNKNNLIDGGFLSVSGKYS